MSGTTSNRWPYKVANEDQSVKKGVAASDMKELISKGLDKLGLPAKSTVTLFLEDGTEVDDADYFKTIPENTTFIFKTKPVASKTKKEKVKDKSPLLPNPLMSIKTQEVNFTQQPCYGPGLQDCPGGYPGYPQETGQVSKIPMKAHRGMYTLTFTTDTLIDLGRIEAEFRRFGPVTASSDYRRIMGRARVFVNFVRGEHASMALQQLGHCFYDLEISKHCLPDEVKNQPFTETVEETDMELYVGNIPKNVGPKKLRNVFKNYNVNFRGYQDKKNHCYVQMFNMNDMMAAIKELNGQVIDNNKLVVRLKEVQKLIDDAPKKKVQIKEEKLLKEKLIKKEHFKEREHTKKEKEMEKNQQKIKEYLQSGVKKESNDSIQCSVCEGTCRRAIKMRCCGVRACRGCAVLKVTKTRECWMWECSKKVSSEDIMNDEELRQKVSTLYKEKVENKDETKRHLSNKRRLKYQLKRESSTICERIIRDLLNELLSGTLLACSLCGSILHRAVTLSCCGAQACRACGVKKITETRSCWMKNCERELMTTADLINDLALRKAVEQFKKVGVMDAEHHSVLCRVADWLNNVKLCGNIPDYLTIVKAVKESGTLL